MQGLRQKGFDGIELLQCVRFWYGNLGVTFELGLYGNGRLAVVLCVVEEALGGRGPDELRYDKLTVNLVDTKIDDDGEIHVRLGAISSSMRSRRSLLAAIEELGLFERTGRTIPAGYIEEYAEVWKWKGAPSAQQLEELSCRYDRGRDQRRAADTVLRARARRKPAE